MNSKPSVGKKVLSFLGDNLVPIMFIIICAICIPVSGFSASYLINEIVTRMGRNIFLILCLLIPIMSGMGLNFGMTLGAMAGEIALILVSDWQIWGIPGVVLAMIVSIPISSFPPLYLPWSMGILRQEPNPSDSSSPLIIIWSMYCPDRLYSIPL